MQFDGKMIWTKVKTLNSRFQGEGRNGSKTTKGCVCNRVTISDHRKRRARGNNCLLLKKKKGNLAAVRLH